MDIEIGKAKRGRRAYSFDDIAIVPSRRTRDPEEVSVSWQIDAYRFEIPVLAAPMDSVMSPATAIAVGKAGGLGVLDLAVGHFVLTAAKRQGMTIEVPSFFGETRRW